MNAYRTLLLALIALIACDASAQTTDATSDNALGPGEVATVNGERIPESVFRLFALNATQTNADLLDDETRSAIVEQLIMLRLLADEAVELGIDRERRVAAELELQRLQTLARYMSDRYMTENPPTTAQIRELYEANLDRLSATRYKVRHIVVSSQSTASELIEELEDGADFQVLAREHSTDPTASTGGDLGWVMASAVPESFAAALQDSSPGDFYPSPVQTEYGWHVVLVEDTEEGSPPSLEELREDLVNALKNQNLAQHAEELRENADVRLE